MPKDSFLILISEYNCMNLLRSGQCFKNLTSNQPRGLLVGWVEPSSENRKVMYVVLKNIHISLQENNLMITIASSYKLKCPYHDTIWKEMKQLIGIASLINLHLNSASISLSLLIASSKGLECEPL
ncbi:hypothetical protein QVD17_04271 [Tagetes erecta]|uniref:Uncharacterized protein n=1 Tax=Tagetes erecta TaxID=13708 RepID=A0AAD8LHC6_TARER|nr:hypothetical protein QVD17_04271 [Tagetes erecta]